MEDRCVPGSPGDRLDFAGMCIERGLCEEIFLEDAEAILGPTDGCTPADPPYLRCTWAAHGITLEQLDGDGDGVPATREETDLFDQTAWLAAPYDGTDPSGLGLGVSYPCFRDALGPPAATTLDGAEIRAASWEYQGAETSTIAITFEAGLSSAITRHYSWSE